MSDNTFRADLHCHTSCSDGTLSPLELIALAKSSGLQGLSITDHDSIDAYTEASSAAEQAGIRLLPGVEFSCNHRGKSIHILGYSFSLKSTLIREFCERHRERRRQRCHAILERLADHDVYISIDDLIVEQTDDPDRMMLGRPHIAQAMVRKNVVGGGQEAFRKYLGEGKCAFVPSLSFSVEETIKLIHRSGGVAVIAHPMLIRNRRILREMLEMNFDGMECHYARFRASDEVEYIKMAQEHNLMVTGGSDFHGDTKPRNTLGCSWVAQNVFDTLWLHYKKVLSEKM